MWGIPLIMNNRKKCVSIQPEEQHEEIDASRTVSYIPIKWCNGKYDVDELEKIYTKDNQCANLVIDNIKIHNHKDILIIISIISVKIND